MTEGESAGSEPGLGRWLSFGLAYALHFALLIYFLPLGLALGDAPIGGYDLGVHLTQNARFLEAMDGWGKTWAYDVQLLAGQPSGVIFDADNKAWELWVWAGTHLGLSFGLACNTFILAAHALVPVTVHVAARCLGLGSGATVAAIVLGSAIWFFDSFTHWCWWVGMVEYALASYLALLPLGLFYRFTGDRRPTGALLTGVTLGLTLLVHPYVFFILVTPMTYLWLRDFRDRTRTDHAWVLLIAAIAIAMNVWWIAVALRFWPHIMDSALYGQAGIGFLVADFFSTILDVETSGHVSMRSGFRLLTWLAGGLMVATWWRSGDRRGRVFAVAIGPLVAVAYLGSYLPLFPQLQPYRFVLPAAYLAALPAGALVVHLVTELRAGRIGSTGRTLALVLSLPALQHLGSDMLHFMPGLQPPLPDLSDGREVPASGTGFPAHLPLSYDNHRQETELAAWVRDNVDDSSRILVQWPALGDALAWRTDAQILGGFSFRNLEHSWANLYRRFPTGPIPEDEMRRYLETYAVGWVILTGDRRWFGRGLSPLLHPAGKVGPHAIFRTRIDADLMREGGGQVHASLNRIQVVGSDPGSDAVLRYHFMDTLVCRPDCRVERTDVDGVDPVGFIRVPAPHPADFEIKNDY